TSRVWRKELPAVVRKAEVAVAAWRDDLEAGQHREDRKPTPIGNGLPAKALAAVCRAILTEKPKLAAGDATTVEAARQQVDVEDTNNKVGQHLAPSGRLVKGGWIER